MAKEKEQSDDPIDIFDDGLECMFDWVRTSHGEPSSMFEYKAPEQSGIGTLKVRVPPQHSVEANLFAHYIWNASLLTSDCIATNYWKDLIHNKTVLELGAGAGLPSLLCVMKGAKEVIVSDFTSKRLIENLEFNIQTTFQDKPEYLNKIKAQGHAWGEDVEESFGKDKKFDTIILADTIWEAGTHDLLLDTLIKSLYGNKEYIRESKVDEDRARQARIIVIGGFHTGRETVEYFFKKADRLGLGIIGNNKNNKIDYNENMAREGKFGRVEISNHGQLRPWQEGLFMIPEDKRKWLVIAQLGWKEFM